MVDKAFDLIVNRTEKALEKQGFARQKKKMTLENGEGVLFTGDTTAYSVVYVDGRFELRSTFMSEEGNPIEEDWKVLSNWIFDPENDGDSEAQSIAEDFVNTVDDSKRKAAIRAAKRKQAGKGENDDPGPVFFFKRLVVVLPELRDEIAIERESYEDFRAVTFAKANIVPKIEALCKKNNEGQIKKLSGILNDFYKSGDLDVRSIITMILLNGLTDQSRNKLLPYMDKEFQKYYPRALRFKGKKVSPERPKKQKSRGRSILSDNGGTARGSNFGKRLADNQPKKK